MLAELRGPSHQPRPAKAALRKVLFMKLPRGLRSVSREVLCSGSARTPALLIPQGL